MQVPRRLELQTCYPFFSPTFDLAGKGNSACSPLASSFRRPRAHRPVISSFKEAFAALPVLPASRAMVKTTAEKTELPLHHDQPTALASSGNRDRGRRLTFEPEGARVSWKEAILSRMRRWVQASTGSPSDGLGKESDSGASFSTFLASQAQLDREREDQDWVLDEVVVTGEESDHKHGSEKGTTTRQSESEHAASLHRGQAGHTQDMGQPDTSGLWGYMRYVIVRGIVSARAGCRGASVLTICLLRSGTTFASSLSPSLKMRQRSQSIRNKSGIRARNCRCASLALAAQRPPHMLQPLR